MRTKTIISILIAIFACTFQANAQLRKVPAEVTNAFSEKYPNATNVEWRDQLVDFKVSFETNSKQYVAKFDNEGNWKVTEELTDQENLPASIKDGFAKSQYDGWEVRYVAIVEMPDNELQYKITVAKNNVNKKDLFFDSNGKLLKDNFTL